MTEMNDAQKQFLKRLRLLGFAVDRNFTARRPLKPVSVTKRLVEIPIKEHFFQLGENGTSLEEVWEKICQSYIALCSKHGGSVITKVFDTPVSEAISAKRMGVDLSRYATDTLEYLIDYNHTLLDKVLVSANGHMNEAWLNLYLFLFYSSVRATFLLDRSAVPEYLLQVRTEGMITDKGEQNLIADREEFTFPYYTFLKAPHLEADYFEKTAKHWTTNPDQQAVHNDGLAEVF